MATDTLATLGRISTPYGVKGWVRVYSYTDPIENILSYRQWVLTRDRRQQVVEVDASAVRGKRLVAHLVGVDDRDSAAEIAGSDVAVYEDQLPSLPAGEYYWRQLEGLEVIGEDGTRYGKLTQLMETGANDVLVVRADDGRERLIPLLMDSVVKNVDVGAGTMVVDWDPEF